MFYNGVYRVYSQATNATAADPSPQRSLSTISLSRNAGGELLSLRCQALGDECGIGPRSAGLNRGLAEDVAVGEVACCPADVAEEDW